MEARIRKLKNNIQSLKSWKTAPLPLLHFTDKSMVTFNLTLIQMDEMHQAWRKQFDICCRKLQQQLCECRGSKICWEKIKDRSTFWFTPLFSCVYRDLSDRIKPNLHVSPPHFRWRSCSSCTLPMDLPLGSRRPPHTETNLETHRETTALSWDFTPVYLVPV